MILKAKQNAYSATKPRIAWVDLLETIAIFFVIFYHCTGYIANESFPEGNPGFYLYYGLRSIIAVCVPLFFFVNGFLLLRHDFDLKRHLRKVIKYILIAIFWYILTLGFLIFLHRNDFSGGLIERLSSVKYGINHLWYLGALVCLYIFFPLLKVTYDHHKKIFIYFTIICALFTFGNTLLNNVLTLFSRQGTIYVDTNFLNIFNPFRGIYGYTFVYFCLGGIAAYYFDKIVAIPKLKRNIIALAGLALGWLGLFGIGVLYSVVSGQIWDNVWYGYDTIFALLTTLSIFILCLNWRKQNKLLCTISKNTLGIYLIHMLIVYALMTIFNDFVMHFLNPLSSSFLMSFLGNIIYTGLILTFSLIAVILLRKIPIIRNIIS